MIIVTAGHIDHGKTSLVEAITGVDADRLREEKRRGITIDLGFAAWPQADGSSISFIDVPGHEDYVHNMLAGVTGAEALLLVIDAHEGIKPQTLEHLRIAGYLGLKHGIVALSKCDLASHEQIESRQHEIQFLLQSMGFLALAVVPVSVRNGQGLARLKQDILDLRENEGHRAKREKPFRMAIDRVFTLQGVGTVVTGSIHSGEVSVEDKLVLSPSGHAVRVRGLQVQNHHIPSATAGMRVAVNLASVNKEDITRGDVLMAVPLHRPTQRIDTWVHMSSSLRQSLPSWCPVHVHSGTGHWSARLVPLTGDRLIPDRHQLVQIVLERAAAVFAGDHLVIRDASASHTIGGGVVLDRRAPDRNRRKPDRIEVLSALASAGPLAALETVLLHPPYALERDECAADNGLAREAFHAAIVAGNVLNLTHGGHVFLLHPAILLQLSRQMLGALRAHHVAQPDQVGLTMVRLRLAVPIRVSVPVFSAVLNHLQKRQELKITGSWVHLPEHRPQLSPAHDALWARIKPLLSDEARFRPPRVQEIAGHLHCRAETVRGLCKRLAKRGDVQEIVTDQFLLSPVVAELANLAVQTAADIPSGLFTAADFRDRIGVGRKMAILVLEYFDRECFTIRKGDLRRIDPYRKNMYVPAPATPEAMSPASSKPHQTSSAQNL